MRKIEPSALIPLCLSATMLFSAGCANIAGGYRVPDGSTQTRSYSSVAGDIEIGRQASIRNVNTVAGDIAIDEGGRVGSLTTVAGEIRLAAEVKVAGSIRTVAGDVKIARGCTIAGDITTVAGHITMTDSAVQGDVTLTSGKLDLIRSRVTGTLLVKRPKDDDADRAEITIGPASEVTEVVVKEEAGARLRIHRTARVGAIKGIEAEYFD